MMNINSLIPRIFKDLDSNNLEKVAKKIFDTEFEDLKMKINQEINNNNNNKIDFEKYDFNFSIDNFEDLMLFIVKSSKLDYLKALQKLSNIDENKANKLNSDILSQISENLMRISYRTIVYDLNLNRSQGQLKSSTEEEQFNEYINRLSQKNYRLEFINKYYNLILFLEANIRQIDKYINNFFELLLKDEKELIDSNEDYLLNISLGLGDTHNQGESVIKCIYTHKSFYFKPRNGKIDQLYNKILDYINKSLNCNLKKTEIIVKKNYFWVNEVDYKECNDITQIENFYYELGMHLFLLYVLGATDFHSENLIASQEHPILVDLESVIGNKLSKNSFKDATYFNHYLLSSSVKTTGILPFIFGNNEGADFSGLGGKEGLSSLKVPTIKNVRSSNMRVESDYIKLSSNQNHPKINEEFVNEKNYKVNLINGFKDCYNFIEYNKNEFYSLIENNINDVNVRYINNATMQYARILNLSFHPLILQSITLRKLFIAYYLYNDFDRLSKYEINNLIDMNIPYFYYNGISKNLFNETKVIENFFYYPLKESVSYKISKLNESDMKWQISIISDSLREDNSSFIPHMTLHSIKNYNNVKNYTTSEKEEKFNSLICSIEEIILEEQIEINNTYSWMTKELYGTPGTRTVEREVMEINLYKGLCGMALYYWALYQHTQDKKYLLKVENLILQIEEEIQYYTDYPIGAYDGIYSYIYLCAVVYKKTKKKKYIHTAIKYINLSKGKISVENDTDFISGLSGVLVILINLYHIVNNLDYKNTIEEAIELSVNTLLNKMHKTNNNLINWQDSEDDVTVGFAHGVSGITYALSLYINNFKYDKNIENIISLANQYEETYRIEHYWPHPYSQEARPPYAWCHGSPGIMLNREKSNYTSNDRKKIIEKIFEEGFSRTHCLCHGDLGNAMILKDILPTSEKMGNIIFDILKNFNAKDLKCGVGEDIQSIDLLTGLSGISYGLIYLMNDDIPNVLRLEI